MAIVSVRGLCKSYSTPEGGSSAAVDRVDFDIESGESFGLGGISGSGKSTVGRIILGLTEPSSGDVVFDGVKLNGLPESRRRVIRSQMQMVFQNPVASMNPRRTARSIIEMPLKAYQIGTPRERRERVSELLNLVGLSPRHAEYYPHEFSGGQCQRLGIARALATSPRFIFLDEPVSALDVSIQAQILNLLKDLQERLSLTYLVVANNLNILRFIADRISIIHKGQIIESGETESVFSSPRHDITKQLLESILSLERINRA